MANCAVSLTSPGSELSPKQTAPVEVTSRPTLPVLPFSIVDTVRMAFSPLTAVGHRPRAAPAQQRVRRAAGTASLQVSGPPWPLVPNTDWSVAEVGPQ